MKDFWWELLAVVSLIALVFVGLLKVFGVV